MVWASDDLRSDIPAERGYIKEFMFNDIPNQESTAFFDKCKAALEVIAKSKKITPDDEQNPHIEKRFSEEDSKRIRIVPGSDGNIVVALSDRQSSQDVVQKGARFAEMLARMSEHGAVATTHGLLIDSKRNLVESANRLAKMINNVTRNYELEHEMALAFDELAQKEHVLQ